MDNFKIKIQLLGFTSDLIFDYWTNENNIYIFNYPKYYMLHQDDIDFHEIYMKNSNTQLNNFEEDLLKLCSKTT